MAFIENLQDRVSSTTNVVALIAAKIFTGLFIGLTLALIFDQILDYGWFSFMLVVTVSASSLFRVMRSWNWVHLFIFNLVCVLTGLLLRMYILIAPG